MIDANNYIVKISKSTCANQVFWKRVYYAKIRRNWISGSKLVFLTKMRESEDVFIGLGKIKTSYDVSVLAPDERKICIQNNLDSKIAFDIMARFLPAVLTRDVKFISLNRMKGPSLDGAYLSDSEISSIEGLAKMVIII